MVYAGARGETETQMAEVFHYLAQEAQHPTFNVLDQRLSRLGEEAAGGETEGDPFQLNIANAIWGQQGFPFKEAYLETLASQYGAGLQVADFAQQPDEAREAINAWVADQTEEHIKDLAPPGVITPDTRLVLVNAIYFKGAWLFPFDEAATQDGPFTLLDGSRVTIPLMQRQTARVPYAEGNGYRAVQLPYTGETVDMLIILPEEGRFAAIEEQLSAGFLDEVRQRAELRDVTLSMPRLDFETALDLSGLLQAMGMTDLLYSGNVSSHILRSSLATKTT
jgi:serpin B